jgi:formylglycine-generating enzyme required for sulfatase activity
MKLPAQWGKYELLEFLGGGMSHVYRARDTVIGRTVAVKILTEESCADADAKARFLREAKTAGNIVHDNIINIFDFGIEQGRPYIVMEFLQGGDLRHAIQNGQTGDYLNRLEIACSIARALEHIHSLNIIHRDIKPDNVNIAPDGRVKLMDFGIAKSDSLNVTRPGFTLGTPAYMAPEQVRGQLPTPKVDIYAFGLLIYELFTGVRPVDGKNVVEIFQKILQEPIDFTPLEQAGVDPALVDLVRRMLSKDPAGRPQGMTEVREVLESLALRGYERQPAPAERPKWLIPAIAGGVLVLVLVAFLGFRAGTAPEDDEPPGPPPPGMVLVPKGRFVFGETSATVELPAFYIDKTEVSIGEYTKFAREKGLPVPTGDPNLPVANITIDEAHQYAQWAGKRLPTMQEWEKAARGEKGFLYPWGEQHDPKRANFADNPDMRKERKLMPVDSMPEGASPYGVLHMAGNVREFVAEYGRPSLEQVRAFAELLSPSPTAEESWCVTRGGAFDEPMPRNVNRESKLVPVRYRAPNIGFRCVRDVR